MTQPEQLTLYLAVIHDAQRGTMLPDQAHLTEADAAHEAVQRLLAARPHLAELSEAVSGRVNPSDKLRLLTDTDGDVSVQILAVDAPGVCRSATHWEHLSQNLAQAVHQHPEHQAKLQDALTRAAAWPSDRHAVLCLANILTALTQTANGKEQHVTH